MAFLCLHQTATGQSVSVLRVSGNTGRTQRDEVDFAIETSGESFPSA